MPLTRTAARTRIRTMVNEPSARYYSNDDINRWIDDAVRDISIRTFCTTIIATQITTTGGVQSYAWPTTLNTTAIITLGIKTILNSSGTALEYIPMHLIGRVGQEQLINEWKWSTWQQKIFLSPVPQTTHQTYPMIWTAASITAAGTLPLPDAYHYLVPLYGAAMAMEKRRNYERAEFNWSRYEYEMDRIMSNATHYEIWIDGRTSKLRDQKAGG